MALNNAFTVGQTLTAAECNNLPFGVADYGSSASNYNLTTSLVAVPGMTVTWTADATRLYKITYVEPGAQSGTLVGQYIALELRLTNAAGTQLQQSLQTNGSAASVTLGMQAVFIGTFVAGSRTVVGCALASSTTGTPRLAHSGTTRGYIVVEDIGLA
tara:strand:+ start:595 stop:1068 length:474 start_codon:yes stop_codon:yes gene_type:complete